MHILIRFFCDFCPIFCFLSVFGFTWSEKFFVHSQRFKFVLLNTDSFVDFQSSKIIENSFLKYNYKVFLILIQYTDNPLQSIFNFIIFLFRQKDVCVIFSEKP